MVYKFPNLKTIVAGFVGSIFAIQILSLLISSLFPSIPLLKGGPAILVMLLGIGIVALFIVGFKLDELKRKENLVFIVIVFGLIALAYWKLPDYFPQIFSIDPTFSESVKQTMGSVFG